MPEIVSLDFKFQSLFIVAVVIITTRKGEILFTDERLQRVIKVANGSVSTLAGNNIIEQCAQNIAGRAQEGYEGGKALTALFNFPKGIAYDSKGNLFIADMNNRCLIQVRFLEFISTRWICHPAARISQ